MAAEFPDRLEDVFQNEVVKRFASITDFRKFARSKDGLCLAEYDIQRIGEDNEQSVEDQKMGMLNLWRVANGEMATDWQIRFLVERYYRVETGDQSDILRLDDMFKLFKKQKLSPRGHVYLGEEKFGLEAVRSCAIKFVEFNEETEREGKIFSKLPEHENIIFIKRVGVHKSFPFDYIYIAMELSWTRNLRDFFTENKENNTPFDEANAKKLTKQLFEGLRYIHENGVIHRDMKPENVSVSNDNTVLKITDFGISKPITAGNEIEQTTKDKGTEGYRAQETYEDGKISPASDVYSTGIIFGEIFSNGHHPYGDNQDLRIYNIKNDLNLDLSHVKSSNRAEITSLIRKTLCYDPLERPSAKYVLENDALKIDSIHLQLYQQKSMSKSPTVSEVPQSTTSQVREGIKLAQTQMSEYMRQLFQSTDLLESWVLWLDSTEELGTSLSSFARIYGLTRTISFSTSTGKEIIIYNLPSSRFDIYKLIDGSLIKFGETKEFKRTIEEYPSMVVAKEYLYLFGIGLAVRTKYLDPNSKWNKVSDASVSLNTSVVALNGTIYNCGSSMAMATFPLVQKYDVNQDRWIRIYPMKTARNLSCLVATEDHIYCFGGKDKKGNRLRSIDRFDPTTEEWKVLDVMLPRYIEPGASVTSIEHRIYIHDNEKILCWDTESDLWTELDISILEFLESEYKSISSLNKNIILVGINESGDQVFSFITSEKWKDAKQVAREEVAPTLD